jgi:N-acyl-D-glutamate deacylase
LSACSPSDDKAYELVINYGRVIDPLSGLDAIRHVGVREGRIVNISQAPLTGEQNIDARGLIVAPGFIDYHWHCPAQACYEIGLKDGLTAAMDLEFGALGSEMKNWYARREGAARINFGTSASVELARALVLDGNKADDALNANISRGRGQKWAVHEATPEEQSRVLADMEAGLKAGAIGIGITLGYKPAVSAPEVYDMQKLAATYGRQACVHLHHTPGHADEEINGAQEILANAAALKAPACINHFNNAGWRKVQDLLVDLRGQGLNVWGDIYPYVAGSTSINTVFFKPEIFEKRLRWT